MSGKLKISGNILAAQKLQQLWSEEAPRGPVSFDEPANEPPKASSNNANEDMEDKALLDVSHLILNMNIDMNFSFIIIS